MKVDKGDLLAWLEEKRDFYEYSPLTHESGRHWMLNIIIKKIKEGAFDSGE